MFTGGKKKPLKAQKKQKEELDDVSTWEFGNKIKL